MKRCGIIFVKCIFRMIYMPMKKMIKTRKKIVYLSRQSDYKSLDMELLSEKIREKYPEYEQVFRLRTLKLGSIGIIKYIVGLLGDMYHIAGSSVAVCDTYSIPISCLRHKESLKVIQIWHAMGAVKKFGLQSLGKKEGRDEKVSKAMDMHRNYDYVAAPSENMAEFYAEAFDTPLDKIVMYTLPRIDYVLDGKTKKQEFLEKNPEAAGKEIVLYLPTFRSGEEKIVEALVSAFKEDADVELIISLHPFSTVPKKEDYEVCGKFSTYDLMKLADHIITDYSACVFEASLLGVPVWFYTPDYERYTKNRGLNINLKQEMPSYVFENAQELYKSIKEKEYDFEDLKKFQKKYIGNTQFCTEKMADFICKETEI